MVLLHAEDISSKDERGFGLKHISFSHPAFSKLAIAGETGSGKTTLLKILGGLIEHDSGTVYFEGKKIIGPQDQLIPGHPGIRFLSQHFELPNNLRVEQVLEYANQLEEGDIERICRICRVSHLLKRRTSQLSGGEKQRIAIARLLLTAPRLLLLDEPFSNADMGHKKMMKAVLRDISDELRITCIMVSHDPMDSLSWADRILVMREGALVQEGAPYEIYNHPVDEYVAGLFGAYNLIPEETARLLSGRKKINAAKHTVIRTGNEALNDNVKGTVNDTMNKAVLVRPEHLAPHPGGIPAEVRQVCYYGTHYEAEVLLNGLSLTIRTNDGGWEPGSSVKIRWKPR